MRERERERRWWVWWDEMLVQLGEVDRWKLCWHRRMQLSESCTAFAGNQSSQFDYENSMNETHLHRPANYRKSSKIINKDATTAFLADRLPSRLANKLENCCLKKKCKLRPPFRPLPFHSASASTSFPADSVRNIAAHQMDASAPSANGAVPLRPASSPSDSRRFHRIPSDSIGSFGRCLFVFFSILTR